MHGFTNLSADGLSQVNTIHILNLCHHCHVHNIFYFRCVHHLFLFRYIQIFHFTNIFSLQVSISLPHYLALSLFISLSSAMFTVTIQTCTLSSLSFDISFSLYLSLCMSLCLSVCLSLSISVCVSLSLSLSLCHAVTLSRCHAVSLSRVSRLASRVSRLASRSLALSLSRALALSLCLSVCLSVCLSLCVSLSHSHQPLSPTLLSSVVDTTSLSLSLSSATLTHFTLFCCGHHLSVSLCLYLSLSLSSQS